jgi:hypothetical protein
VDHRLEAFLLLMARLLVRQIYGGASSRFRQFDECYNVEDSDDETRDILNRW